MARAQFSNMADDLDMEEDDLAGGLDLEEDQDQGREDMSRDMRRSAPLPGPAPQDTPDMDRYADENWRVLARCRARLEVLADTPRAAIKDRVAAARGAAAIAQHMIVLVGLDKTKEDKNKNGAAIEAARKAAARAVTLDMFGQDTPKAPPPFVTKVGDTQPHRAPVVT